MTTIRVSKRTRFTVIDRATVNDADLSYRARGVLLWLLDKPDDWQTDSNAIARAGKEGRDAVRAALKELQTCGYLARERKQVEHGKWVTDVLVYERPKTDSQAPDGDSDWEPEPDLPTPEKASSNTEDLPTTTDVFRDSTIASLSEIPKTKAPWVALGITAAEYRQLEAESVGGGV